ncbi:MAG: hypothetical protein ACFE9R_03390 [Candidatus Hermodarchaeota archaeon]
MGEDNNKELNVKDWIILSTTMIGAVLTILALIWQARPNYGIVTATFFLMLSFVMFVNSVSANSKANFEVKSGQFNLKLVNKFVKFAEYSFGIGFTLVINGFSLLGYEYIKDFTGFPLLALSLPAALLVLAWFMMAIYSGIDKSGRESKSLKIRKRTVYTILEVLVLVIITIDSFGFFTIP